MSEPRPDETPAPAAVFWAMRSQFSYAALRGYLAAGGQVRAVLIPLRPTLGDAPAPAWRPILPVAAPVSRLPMLSTAVEPSVLSLAHDHGIAAFEVGHPRDPAFAHLLTSLRAEVACVACWPRRIPRSVLARFPLGVLNLHPSLLPLHRGPAPLFWTLRHGDASAGVTIHLMDETLDTGPLLAQQPVTLEDGLTGFVLEQRCAAVGGELLAAAVRDLTSGRARPRSQEPGAGSYEPWPQPSDFRVSAAGSARWAYNFACGAVYWGGPVVIECGAQRFAVREPVSYSLHDTLDAPWQRDGDVMLVRCQPGVLRVIAG
jgi:methionyl-tRNA formyltransferase